MGVFFENALTGDQPRPGHAEVAQKMAAIVDLEVEQLADAIDLGECAPCQADQGCVHDGCGHAALPHPGDAEGHAAVELILNGFDFGKFGHRKIIAAAQ